MKSSLECCIGNIKFDSCLSNASGVYCTLEDELKQLDESASGALISKSCSLDYRAGNEKPRYYDNELGTLNSMGLPNEGYKYYENLVGKFKKPYMVSVAGNYLRDDVNILEALNKRAIDKDITIMVEINVSCPNIAGKEQLAYNFEDLDEFLFRLAHYEFSNLMLGLKLPPYFDPVHFDKLHKVISKYYSELTFLTAINSVGNALMIDVEQEKVVIKPKQGLGGLGGDYIKPIALSNVWQLHRLFGEHLSIIGCGGIRSGEDVFEHLLCGASFCQIGSQLMKEGPGCFERINNELLEIMESKNYKSINDICGKLQVI